MYSLEITLQLSSHEPPRRSSDDRYRPVVGVMAAAINLLAAGHIGRDQHRRSPRWPVIRHAPLEAGHSNSARQGVRWPGTPALSSQDEEITPQTCASSRDPLRALVMLDVAHGAVGAGDGSAGAVYAVPARSVAPTPALLVDVFTSIGLECR